MFKFYLEKNSDSKISPLLVRTFSDKTAINKHNDEDSDKRAIEERKLKFDMDKLDLECKKLALDEKKYALEERRIALEIEHKEKSYKYAADIAAKSRTKAAHIRGAYGLWIGLLTIGVGFYANSIDREAKARDRKMDQELSDIRNRVNIVVNHNNN